MDQDVGFWIIIVLTFAFMAFYFWGRNRNYKIQKNVWGSLKKWVAPYSKKVDFKSFGTSAFQISVPGRKTDFFRRAELTVTLLSREIPLYYLLLKMRGKKDELIVKARFKTAPKVSLEIIPRKMKVPERLRSKFKEVETEFFEDLSVFASKETLAKVILNENSIKRGLKGIEKDLRFLSLSAEEPHLIFACSISPNIFPRIFPLIRSLSLKSSELSMTGKRRKDIQ